MQQIKVKVNTSTIRLDQLLKFANIAKSGGHAKYIIKSGIVKVNGLVEVRRTKKIYKGDEVEIKGQVKLIVE